MHLLAGVVATSTRNRLTNATVRLKRTLIVLEAVYRTAHIQRVRLHRGSFGPTASPPL